MPQNGNPNIEDTWVVGVSHNVQVNGMYTVESLTVDGNGWLLVEDGWTLRAEEIEGAAETGIITIGDLGQGTGTILDDAMLHGHTDVVLGKQQNGRGTITIEQGGTLAGTRVYVGPEWSRDGRTKGKHLAVDPRH